MSTTIASTARVWVYQSNRLLTETEIAEIKDLGNAFVANWAAHKVQLEAAFDVLHNYFIVLAVDENQAKASGCSIDSSVHFIKQIEQQFQLDLFNRLNVVYNNNGNLALTNAHDLAKKIKQGDLPETILVFDNTITTAGQLESNWLVPANTTWLKNLL